MTTEVKWSIEADYLQACSCDYGCPCEFEAPPTQGFCEGTGAYRINRGSYGGVSLDGLGLGIALHSPAALHLGNVTLALFVDEKASQGRIPSSSSPVTGFLIGSKATEAVSPILALTFLPSPPN